MDKTATPQHSETEQHKLPRSYDQHRSIADHQQQHVYADRSRRQQKGRREERLVNQSGLTTKRIEIERRKGLYPIPIAGATQQTSRAAPKARQHSSTRQQQQQYLLEVNPTKTDQRSTLHKRLERFAWLFAVGAAVANVAVVAVSCCCCCSSCWS